MSVSAAHSVLHRPCFCSRPRPTARHPVFRFARPPRCLNKDLQQQRSTEERIAGRSIYSPDSFEVIVKDACASALYAINNGETRMEVEFPPLPASVSGYKGASDDFLDANVQFAIVAAKQLVEKGGKRVRLLFPDEAESDRAGAMHSYTVDALDGLSLGTTSQSFIGKFQSLMGTSDVDPMDDIDVFIVLNHSTIELPAVRKFVEDVAKDRAVVLWNLELETLRADLGLLGFPSRALHFEFLSRFKAVFFLRLRDYSKSIATAPFLVNYSGALFREYPGPWQVLLKQDNGQYVCVAEDRVRYTLFEVKESLMQAMGLNTEEQDSPLYALRRGYKRSTWWEADLENETSRNWRS